MFHNNDDYHVTVGDESDGIANIIWCCAICARTQMRRTSGISNNSSITGPRLRMEDFYIFTLQSASFTFQHLSVLCTHQSSHVYRIVVDFDIVPHTWRYVLESINFTIADRRRLSSFLLLPAATYRILHLNFLLGVMLQHEFELQVLPFNWYYDI